LGAIEADKSEGVLLDSRRDIHRKLGAYSPQHHKNLESVRNDYSKGNYPPNKHLLALADTAVEVDGKVFCFAVGPDSADMVQACGPGVLKDALDGWEDGGEFFFRLGKARVEDLENLPEHQGW